MDLELVFNPYAVTITINTQLRRQKKGINYTKKVRLNIEGKKPLIVTAVRIYLVIPKHFFSIVMMCLFSHCVSNKY